MIMISIYTFIFFIVIILSIFLDKSYKNCKYAEKINWYTSKIIDIPIQEVKNIYPERDYKYLEFENTYDSLGYIDKNNLYNEEIYIVCDTLIEVYLVINRRKEVKKEEILKRIENAERELKEAKKELENYEENKYKRYKPEHNQHYYFINESNNISEMIWYNSNTDNARFSFGNCYKTKEDAKRASERQQVKTMLEDIALELNADEIIDWENDTQQKFYIEYNYYFHELVSDRRYCGQFSDTIYCLNPDFLDIAIKRIGRTRLENYIKGV